MATNTAMATLKKPFEHVKHVTMMGVNTVAEVGGYHEISVGAVQFRASDENGVPDTKFVEVTANQSTTIADRCVGAILQQSKSGHVETKPLTEAMTVYKVTYPVLSNQIHEGSTNYVSTTLSLGNIMKVKYDDKCPKGCPCPMKRNARRAPHEQPWAEQQTLIDGEAIRGNVSEPDEETQERAFQARQRRIAKFAERTRKDHRDFDLRSRSFGEALGIPSSALQGSSGYPSATNIEPLLREVEHLHEHDQAEEHVAVGGCLGAMDVMKGTPESNPFAIGTGVAGPPPNWYDADDDDIDPEMPAAVDSSSEEEAEVPDLSDPESDEDDITPFMRHLKLGASGVPTGGKAPAAPAAPFGERSHFGSSSSADGGYPMPEPAGQAASLGPSLEERTRDKYQGAKVTGGMFNSEGKQLFYESPTKSGNREKMRRELEERYAKMQPLEPIEFVTLNYGTADEIPIFDVQTSRVCGYSKSGKALRKYEMSRRENPEFPGYSASTGDYLAAMGPEEFKRNSCALSNALRYNCELPRDDVDAVHNEILADELNLDTKTLDQLVWSSQGSHDMRFERIEIGKMVTIRAKYKNKSNLGPEFICTEYNREAAFNITKPDHNGSARNTLGIFNDLFPCEKYTFGFEKTGADHNPTFKSKVMYKGFVGEGSDSTLQASKLTAMGRMLQKMLLPNNGNLKEALILNNREKRVLRAYGCIGAHKPDGELLNLVTDQLRRSPGLETKEIARILGITVKAVNQVCYHNTDKFTKLPYCRGWALTSGEEKGPIYKKLFGKSATATIMSKAVDLREVCEFNIQVPARYACLALAMTAGNTGVANISYVGTRFRSVLSDDDQISRDDVDVYTNALTLLAFVTRNAMNIPYAAVDVVHKGSAFLEVCIDQKLTVDEKFALLEKEKRSRAGMHVLASYDATNFAGDFEGVRTVVTRNLGSKKDVDQPNCVYNTIQTAPNYMGTPGPLETQNATAWFSGIMRNMSDGEKKLCPGVVTKIQKFALGGKARENYLKALKIVAKGDVKLFVKRIQEGAIGADCQTPPSRFSEEKAAELYNIYSDWYDRVGPKLANHRMYILLGLIEVESPESMKSFLKPGECDDRNRIIQPTDINDGHTVCNGNVVKTIAETVKLSRGANYFKGLTENGKKCYFGHFRKLAHEMGASLHEFDRSKQDHATSLMFLECYEDYMEEFSNEMLRCGYDKIANTMYSSKNKATKCTTEEWIIKTEHAWAMLTSACAQTSDGNRLKTEVELLTMLFDAGWTHKDVQAVYDSWNNKDHSDIVYDCDENAVRVPNKKMIWPIKIEGDDVASLDKHGIFEKENTAHCVKIAAFNAKYSTSWIPSPASKDHGPLSPIDTLSVLYFSDNDRSKQDKCTKLPSGRPDFAIPHPVKKAQSLVTMYSPANIKFKTELDGTVNCIMDDPTRIAIVTAKVSQARTMTDCFWLRRDCCQAAEFFLKDHEDIKYIAQAKPIYDPRDPVERGIGLKDESPVVQQLVEVNALMPNVESSRELLIANAEAWRLTCPELSNVPVTTIAAELACLDTQVDEEGLSKDDFDIRYSYNRVRSIAPNIAKVCEHHISRTIGRLETVGGEGTKARLEQQKTAVGQLLSVGGKRKTYEEAIASATKNEQSTQRKGAYWKKQVSNRECQRRGASESSNADSTNANWQGSSGDGTHCGNRSQPKGKGKGGRR